MVIPPKLNSKIISSAKAWLKSNVWGVVVTLLTAAILYLVITRVNSSPTQNYIAMMLSIISIAQYWIVKKSDLAALIIQALGFWVIFSLYSAENLAFILMMVLAFVLSFFLTYWQGLEKFTPNLLLRHAYISGLVSLQVVAFMAFWNIYDDNFGKAILSTVILYLVWGVLDGVFRKKPIWKLALSYGIVSLLLAVIVIATMNPVVGTRIHP